MKFFKSLLLVVALTGFVLAQSVPNNPIQAVLYRSQILTTPQKTQARANIDAPSTAAIALLAPLASPIFSGVPAVPTAATGTNTTQAASTAFVQTALGAPTVNGVAYGTGTTQAFTGAATSSFVLIGGSPPSFSLNAPSAAQMGVVNAANLDANADRGAGARVLVSSTGSTNFPTTPSVALEARRSSGSISSSGTFQISAQNDDGLNAAYFRKVTGFTTVDTWGAWRQFAFLDSPLNPTLLSAAVPTTKGGTGLTTIGTALQVLRVNSGATALEFATVSGGSGSPGGSDSQIQYNSAGAFAASANLAYSSANNRVSHLGTNPTIEIQEGADPAAPAAGRVYLYAKNIAGQTVLKRISPSGVDSPLQDAIAFNQIASVMPGGTTVMTSLGTAFTNVGTVSHPAPASTNLGTSMRRGLFTSVATAGGLNSHRQTTALVWRGNAVGLGGFRLVMRFKLDTMQVGQRGFFGLSSILTAPTNVDPTTLTAQDAIGVSFNLNTGNWKLQNNVTGAAPTVLDLGATFPLDVTSAMELILFAAPNASSVGYRITNMSTTATTSGSLTTNLPTGTAFLAPLLWNTNNATAAAVAFSLYKWTLESDY